MCVRVCVGSAGQGKVRLCVQRVTEEEAERERETLCVRACLFFVRMELFLSVLLHACKPPNIPHKKTKYQVLEAVLQVFEWMVVSRGEACQSVSHLIVEVSFLYLHDVCDKYEKCIYLCTHICICQRASHLIPEVSFVHFYDLYDTYERSICLHTLIRICQSASHLIVEISFLYLHEVYDMYERSMYVCTYIHICHRVRRISWLMVLFFMRVLFRKRAPRKRAHERSIYVCTYIHICHRVRRISLLRVFPFYEGSFLYMYVICHTPEQSIYQSTRIHICQSLPHRMVEVSLYIRMILVVRGNDLCIHVHTYILCKSVSRLIFFLFSFSV